MLHKTDCEETSPQNGRRQERISDPVHCVHRARESPTGTKVRGRGCGADAGPGSRYSGRDALRVGALGTLSPRLGPFASLGLSESSPGRDLDAFDGRTLRRRRIGCRLGRRVFMDHLPHLIDFFVDPGFGPLDAFLAQVDRVGEQRESLRDSFGVTAFLQLNALGLEETVEVLIKFVFVDWFHSQSS